MSKIYPLLDLEFVIFLSAVVLVDLL